MLTVVSASKHLRYSCDLQIVRLLRSRARTIQDSKVLSDTENLSDVLPTNSPETEARIHSSRSLANGTRAKPSSYEVSEVKEDKMSNLQQSPKLLGKNVAEAIRSEKKTLQTPNQSWIKQPTLCKWNPVNLSKLLRKNVIYADENFVILNKPYGITAHDGDEVSTSLRSCLPVLSKMVYGMNTSIPLILCNRLDKGTTGITVCATNKDHAYEVMGLFRHQTVRRKYWAITLGTPVPQHGVVDIPLHMRHIKGDRRFRSHSRMALAPEQKLDYETGQMVDVQQRRPNIATTHYKVLDTNEGLSLVEFQPFTTAKHQIRVHAAEGLFSCILGDHKYSQMDRLMYQRLPSSVLSRFHLKPTKSRDMPMHLHLRELILPGILESSSNPNLLVSAKAPEHIFRTMKLFKLKPGEVTDFKYATRLDTEPAKHQRNNPIMEELYTDPFAEGEIKSDQVQRDDCYTVYKSKLRVKFQYGQEAKRNT